MLPIKDKFSGFLLSLTELLTDIGTGSIQLPDFQRDWLWQDEDIRSLIASVSQSFPIGSVMVLETGGNDVHFQPRLIEGVEPRDAQKEPAELILDGQHGAKNRESNRVTTTASSIRHRFRHLQIK